MYISPVGCFFLGIGVGVLASVIAVFIAAVNVHNRKGK